MNQPADSLAQQKRVGRTRVQAEHLRIRHAEPSDYEGVSATMATPKAYAGTLQLPMPSMELRRERMAKPDPNGVFLIAEVRDPEVHGSTFEIVGSLGLDAFKSLRRRHALALGMAVRDDWQGRGIGTALMTAAIDRADNWMNVLRIELTVYADNEAACALYRRFGFVIEGRHRAYALRDGVYIDAHAMARLHPHQPMLPAPLKEDSP
ncbi:MAG: GNAT family N-acetyltransferase [Burkholderiaceae bacterium]